MTSERARRGRASSDVDSDGGDPKVFLIAAVLIAMAAPVVVYAIDDDAPPEVRHRWRCFDSQARLTGGLIKDPDFAGATGFAGVEGSLGISAFGLGVDAELGGGALGYANFGGRLLLRPPPKAHIEGALGLGVRTIRFGDRNQISFELSLPHRYLFDRDARSVGVEIRPALQIDDGLDARLDLGIFFEPSPDTHIGLGFRAFSVQSELAYGGFATFGLRF